MSATLEAMRAMHAEMVGEATAATARAERFGRMLAEMERQEAGPTVPTQIKTAPGAPPVRAVEPSKDTDRNVMTALEILGKTEDWLNERCAKQLDWHKDWTDLSPKRKGELLAGLNRLVDKKVAEAKS